jgi:hypothetical protein
MKLPRQFQSFYTMKMMKSYSHYLWHTQSTPLVCT